MKGSPELIDKLNELLAGEITAINQYMLHAEMCEDWGLVDLHKEIETRAITEMHHAERLMSRILFLEGKPIVSNLNEIHIGAEVPKMIDYDHQAEVDTVRDYNDAIILAAEEKDHATRDILVEILRDEDAHVDELEEWQDMIERMGLENFIALKSRSEK